MVAVITEPRLPDAACRRWYATVTRRRHLARQWSSPEARVAADLAFWHRYAGQNHGDASRTRRHLRVVR